MCEPFLRSKVWAACILFQAVFGFAQGASIDETAPSSLANDALALSLLHRAETEVSNIKVLVEQGTLPQGRLLEAEDRLADASDELILTRTLYGTSGLEEMTPEQATAMTEAAGRRVVREEKIVQDRRGLLEAGIMARSEYTTLEEELAARKRVLDLAQSRVRLLDQLQQMAEAERRLESTKSLNSVMIRYDGSGVFTLRDLTTVSTAFERKFHRALPVSALGQTLVHQSMGLDHRGRVDVSLSPNSAEGLWLRRLLEQLHLPYLAFRSAFAGAATASHIHIGTGSRRLALARR